MIVRGIKFVLLSAFAVAVAAEPVNRPGAVAFRLIETPEMDGEVMADQAGRVLRRCEISPR